MSAVLKDAPRLARMEDGDLAEVLAIEGAIYSHPWTRGNFADSLRAGYQCWTWRLGHELLGYFVLLVAAGEGHLLNLSVVASHQRTGHGSALLKEAMGWRAAAAPSTFFWKCGRATWAPRRCTGVSVSTRWRCVRATTRLMPGAKTHWC